MMIFLFFKLYKFHAFWQAHFDRNTALTGIHSDCGGLCKSMDNSKCDSLNIAHIGYMILTDFLYTKFDIIYVLL